MSLKRALIYFLMLWTNLLFADPRVFQCFKDYFPVKHIAPTKEITIHYFYSFQCEGCEKVSPILNQYFFEKATIPVFKHPIAINQAGAQLIRAYIALDSHQQGQKYVQSLYRLGKKNRITLEDLKKLMMREGHETFADLWERTDPEYCRSLLKDNLELAKNYRLSALPMIYVVGPCGAYSIYPNKDLNPEDIPDCIDAVVGLQEKGRLRIGNTEH